MTRDDEETKSIKAKILLNNLGSDNYKMLASLTAPDLPNTKSYEEIVRSLTEHFIPIKNILSEQHKFFVMTQSSDENITKFVARLKEGAKTCEFKGCSNAASTKMVIELLLKTQFIRSLQDREIREKILQEGDITFENALKIALAIEAAKVQNREINIAYNSNQTVNKIDNGNKLMYKKKNKNNPERNNETKVGEIPPELHRLCLHCGKNNYNTKECRIISKLKCSNFNKRGHIKKYVYHYLKILQM